MMNLSSKENRIRTAYHEAGHAVAFYRLFGDDGRYGGPLTIEPREDLLGGHSAEELCFSASEEVTAEEQQSFENEAIYACAGYAATLAAGYSDDEALDGCEMTKNGRISGAGEYRPPEMPAERRSRPGP